LTLRYVSTPTIVTTSRSVVSIERRIWRASFMAGAGSWHQ
jgi:hypothetical protein